MLNDNEIAKAAEALVKRPALQITSPLQTSQSVDSPKRPRLPMSNYPEFIEELNQLFPDKLPIGNYNDITKEDIAFLKGQRSVVDHIIQRLVQKEK